MKDVNGAYQIWMRQLSNKADKTKRDYVKDFKRFLDWCKKTPDQLREMKFQEENKKEPWLRTEVENLVREYIGFMKKKDYAGATIHARLAAVRSFFNAQNLPLHLNRHDQPRISNLKARGTPTRKDVRKIVDCSDNLRDRALILFLKDTGLRASDVATFLWKDLKQVGEGFWSFKIETVKKGVKARGFVGPETVEALETYKRQREIGSKYVKPETDIDDHPLFAPLPESGHFDQGETRLKANAVGHAVRAAIIVAGFDGKYSAHSLRKFWEQSMRADREAYLKQLNGRKLSGEERAYYWRTEEQLFELYKENYENLKILGSIIKASEIEQIVEARLKERIGERDKQQKEEIEKLKGDMQRIQPFIDLLNSFKDNEDILKTIELLTYLPYAQDVSIKLNEAEFEKMKKAEGKPLKSKIRILPAQNHKSE